MNRQEQEFRVHTGYTRAGRDRWVYFDDLDKARKFCDEVFREYGVVLLIEEVDP